MSKSIDRMNAVNWQKIFLFLVLICMTAYLGWTRYVEYIELDEHRKKAERRKKKESSPVPITHADSRVLVPLRQLDQFSLRILDSDEWSEELVREAILAPVQHAGIPEFQRRLTSLERRIEQLESRAGEISKLPIPDELAELHGSDLKTYEKTMELLRLRRDHLAQVCETGSLLASTERSALIAESKELTKEIRSSLVQQQNFRKALLQKYNGEATYALPAMGTYPAHTDVAQSMLSLLDSKYQTSRSLWDRRRRQEEMLAELQVAESPPYLLIPQHQARIRYHQSVVELAKSLMRNEPKTRQELAQRTKSAEASFKEFEREQRILKLYPGVF